MARNKKEELLRLLEEKKKRDRKKEMASKTKECKEDIFAFSKFFFPHYFENTPADVHFELYETINDYILHGKAGKILRVLPRGLGKSTLFNFFLPIWCICYGYRDFILILSEAQETANLFLDNIKAEFETNELLIEAFGDMKGNVWRKQELLFNNGVRLKTFGSGSRLRGTRSKQSRPSLVIADDILSDNRLSQKARQTTKDWYFKSVSKVGNADTLYVVIGTQLHFDDLIADLLENAGYDSKKFRMLESPPTNEELWQAWKKIYTNLGDENRRENARKFYEENKDALDEGAKVLWSDRFPLYWVQQTRIDDGEASFQSELQNNPRNDELCIFDEEHLQFFELKEIEEENKRGELLFYGLADPSMGETSESDFSALIVVAQNIKTKQLYIVEADLKRRNPDKIIEDVLRQCKTYPIKTYFVEANGFQTMLYNELTKRAKKERARVFFKKFKTTQNKRVKIEGLQPYIFNGYIKFQRHQTELISQTINFPIAKHDDGIDGVAMIVEQIEKSGGIVGLFDKSKLGL